MLSVNLGDAVVQELEGVFLAGGLHDLEDSVELDLKLRLEWRGRGQENTIDSMV